MRRRTRARELTLQFLYQVDARGDEILGDLDEYLAERSPEDEEVRRFARDLVKGTLEMRPDIDGILSDAAKNWQLSRMAIIDRNILRMATYEMLHLPDIPAKVSINEAIELGKRYSTQQSGSFINGILDRIRREKQI